MGKEANQRTIIPEFAAIATVHGMDRFVYSNQSQYNLLNTTRDPGHRYTPRYIYRFVRYARYARYTLYTLSRSYGVMTPQGKKP
jgi:hypothetical protein